MMHGKRFAFRARPERRVEGPEDGDGLLRGTIPCQDHGDRCQL